MANDGQVIIEVTADNKKAVQSIKQLTSEIQSESKKWDNDVKAGTGSIEDAFSSMASKLGGMFSAAKIGKALLDFASDAIDVASSLQEVQNVVDTTFGDNADQIEAWAKKAGTQFGLTELQAKKFTSTLGAMMKSAGLAGPEIVQMSTDLSGLAADMASFYNLDFEEAFQKIRAGISGETEPLKQLGVNMSVANLEAFALSQGLKKTFNEMDQGEQTLLRYQYLMQATADAQGDFSKTADGFENAKRRITTAVDQIKASVGKNFIDAVSLAASEVAGFLEQITKKPESTVLDDFNAIEIDTAQKMADLEATYNKAQDIIKIIEQISQETLTLKDGSTVTFEELFKDLGNIEQNGGDVRGYIESLGLDVDDVIQKYNIWKESTRQLTSLIPSLSNVIDNETGSIDGGTEALQRNLDEWKANQEKKIAWAAYYAKKEALAVQEASVWQLRLDVMGKEQAKKRIRQTLEEIGTVFDENGKIDTSQAWWDPSKVAEGFDVNDFIDMAAEYEDAVNGEAEANERLTANVEANAQAQQELDDIYNGLIETYGEAEDAADDAGESAEEAAQRAKEWADEMKTAVPDADKAIKALADHIKGVKDSTEQMVNSTLKGFDKITLKYDELNNKSTELGTQLGKAETTYAKEIESIKKKLKLGDSWIEDIQALGEESKEWQSLTKEEQAAYNALVKLKNAQKETNDELNKYKPEGMMAGLQSQMDFMTKYLDNLKKAQEWGLSAEFLASLADGSEESASMLAGLIEGGPEAAAAVDELFQEVQGQKKSFVDSLTEQKLAADQTYDALVDKALETISALNLGEEAEAAMADTVGGLAQGIADKVPEVQSAVDSIEEQLNRLSGYGFSFSIGDFSISFGLDGEHETGLDRVPFNGYLASLHEGEGILTAEENRIWQRFKNGDASSGNVDYDTLGGVMRDNIHAGGNVYLDGRTVGHVVSGIQGRNYRNLQRSGWQG